MGDSMFAEQGRRAAREGSGFTFAFLALWLPRMEKMLPTALGQDVSRLERREKQLLLSRLFARLAHEIRNPLSSLGETLCTAQNAFQIVDVLQQVQLRGNPAPGSTTSEGNASKP